MRAASLVLPVFTLSGIYVGGVWNYTGFAFIFGSYFAAELILWVSGAGISARPEDERSPQNAPELSLTDRYGLQVFVLLHLISFFVSLFLLSKNPIGLELLGGILSLGVQAGSIGGLSGHEFLHSRKKFEKFLGLMTYGVMNYAHFEVSHLYGHHRFVGTESDWSTARSGESYYRFWYRAVVHGYLGAWKLECEILKRRKKSVISLLNRPLVYALLQVALFVSIVALWGLQAGLVQILISIVAWSQIEAINYMSHYGLVRRKDANGRLEKISGLHSWESNNKATNWFVFNTGKHAHHHADQCASHYELKLSHLGDYIPLGLPTMTLVSLIPPLFFAIMDPQVQKRRELVERKSALWREEPLEQVSSM
jgi:alkane 1-monooxygenase